LPSPETAAFRRVPVRPLIAKELREVFNGRALWTMLILLCPLVGYSFFQATALYGEASAAARDSPAMASGLSPLDGVLVPTFGAFYLAITLLFPFVAIRVLGREKETGALRLLVQLPYRTATLISAKMAAVTIALIIALIPALSTLALWEILGGHLSAPETINLLGGICSMGCWSGRLRCSRPPSLTVPRPPQSSRSPSRSAPGFSISRLPDSQACSGRSRACR
jgi:hypothetical protein